jgi:hypothetical protein
VKCIKNRFRLSYSLINFLKILLFILNYSAILNFQAKKFSIKVLFLPKVNNRKIDKNIFIMYHFQYNFRRHLELSRHFELLRLATNFLE